jgi:prefoldin subunit 5
VSECKVVKIITCPSEHKKKLKRKKKTGISLLERLRRLRAQVARIRSELTRLTAFTNQIRNDVNTLQAQISAQTGVRQILLSRLNTSIVIETDAGAISGTLIEVGTDYVAVLEPSGAIVIIPISEINSFV